MYLKCKAISCIATLTTCLLVGHSSTADAVLSLETGLHVQKIELADPAKNLNYLSKITFCRVNEEIYTGKHVGVGVVCKKSPRHYYEHLTEGTAGHNSLVISSTFLHGGGQKYWNTGPWCPQEMGFSYNFHLPKHGKLITVFDTNRYLTRGLLETLTTKDSENTSVARLQSIAAQQIIAPLKTFFDYQCQKHKYDEFKHILDFTQQHNEYYQEVMQEDGRWKTVRINPADHNFICTPRNVLTMFTCSNRCATYNAIKTKAEKLCHTVVYGGICPLDINGTLFKITLSDSIKQANNPLASTTKQELDFISPPVRGWTKQTAPPKSIQIKTETQDPHEINTQDYPVTSQLPRMTDKDVTVFDDTRDRPHITYKNVSLTLNAPHGERLITVGPVYYEESDTESDGDNFQYVKAVTFLSKESQRILQQNASGLQTVLESKE